MLGDGHHQDSLCETSLPLVHSVLFGGTSSGSVGDDLASLHPSVRAAREDHTKASLASGDVARSPPLAQHFSTYGVADFFDHRGQRVFQNLSLSVAAKKYPEIGRSFGSAPARDPRAVASPGRKQPSARAYRLATEMIQKDREATKKRNAEQFQSLTEGEKVQWSEAQTRQQDMLFYEVPTSELVLPRGVSLNDILPVVGTRLQEREERRLFEKMNHDLMEGNFQTLHAVKLQNWIFQEYEDVREIMNWVNTWVAASGLVMQLGMDRCTYCQFVLDLGLVEQDRVPYVWAVSIFDERAKKLRASPVDPEWMDPHLEGRTPTLALVSKWDVVCILDAIIRRRFGASAAGVAEFMNVLRAVGSLLEREFERRDRCEASHREADARSQAATRYRAGQPGRVLAAALPPPQPPPAAGDRRRPPTKALTSKASSTDLRGGSIFDSSAWRRQRRISGMMIEPEVLQLVEQHRAMFEQLFFCYAEEAAAGGGLAIDFAGFLQFCQDFNIVPRLASRHEVLRAFRASECAEAILASSAAAAGPPRTATGPGSCGGSFEPPELPPMFGSEEAPEAPAEVAAPIQDDHGKHKKGRGKGKPQVVYRLEAFIECLIRIAFAYLLTYGNAVQGSASSRAKMVWLVVYLHQTFVSLQRSHGRRSRGELSTRPSTAATTATRPPTSEGPGRRLLSEFMGQRASASADATLLRRRRQTTECSSSVRQPDEPMSLRQSADTGALSRPWSIESARQAFGATAASGSSAPTGGWPSRPSTVGGGLSRRLAAALEQLQPSIFLAPEPPPLQLAPAVEVSMNAPMVLNAKALASYGGSQGGAGEQERRMSDAGSESPSMRSESSRGSKAKSYRRARKNRHSFAGSMAKVSEFEDKVESHHLLPPLPRDAWTAEALTLRALLRSSAEGAAGWDDVAPLLAPPKQHQARALSLDALPETPGEPHGRGPRGDKPPSLTSPRGACHSRRWPPAAGAEDAPQSDREALLWQLHRDEPKIDRSALTPPPMNALASSISERIGRSTLPPAAVKGSLATTPASARERRTIV